MVAACQESGVKYDSLEDSVIDMAERLRGEYPSAWLEFCKKFRVQLMDGKFYNTSNPSDLSKLIKKISDKYGPDSN